MTPKTHLPLFAFLILFSLSSNATIIDHGDYISDTATGFDWLDLGQTVNKSYTQVALELGSGSVYDGWSIASLTDLHGLLDPLTGFTSYATLRPTWGLGVSAFDGASVYAHANYTPGATFTSGIILNSHAAPAYFSAFASPSVPYDYIGTALYRESIDTRDSLPPETVPEPTILLLMGAGIAGFGFSRKRSKAQA